jgi:hypothetical protein
MKPKKRWWMKISDTTGTWLLEEGLDVEREGSAMGGLKQHWSCCA